MKLEIEIELSQPWSNDAQFTVVKKDAVENAKTCLMQGLILNGLSVGPGSKHPGARIVGDPVVTAIIVTEKK